MAEYSRREFNQMKNDAVRSAQEMHRRTAMNSVLNEIKIPVGEEPEIIRTGTMPELAMNNITVTHYEDFEQPEQPEQKSNAEETHYNDKIGRAHV